MICGESVAKHDGLRLTQLVEGVGGEYSTRQMNWPVFDGSRVGKVWVKLGVMIVDPVNHLVGKGSVGKGDEDQKELAFSLWVGAADRTVLVAYVLANDSGQNAGRCRIIVGIAGENNSVTISVPVDDGGVIHNGVESSRGQSLAALDGIVGFGVV